MNPFLYRLMLAHARLDAELRSEQKRRAPDTFRLLRLKKLKLVIKDRMHRLMRPSRHAVASHA